MLEFIKRLFGKGPKVDYANLVRSGAVILDVRSKAEFVNGHVPTAINIPLDQLAKNLNKLKDTQNPIIACCASGMRSAAAKRLLKSKGYTAVYNAGSWSSLNAKLFP
jgi:phage shock protein E